tara:strand:+ start:2232 stop:3350 length:1119 start_codon:yes stop_codon:yes gene_type:complete
MKRILSVLTILLFSCDSGDLDSKKKKLDNLKNSLVETYSEIDKLEKEISQLDSSYNSKNYELVSTSALNIGSFISKIELRGNIQSKKNILIVSEVVGKFKNIFVDEGQYVEKGTVLASIDSEIIQNNLREIKSNLDLLKTIYERQANLWENEIGSELDFLRAKSNYESIKNRYGALKIQLSKFNILAPFSGVVDNINAKVGEMSSPGIPSFRMYNDSDSYISVDVSENFINSFKAGDSVQVINSGGEIYKSKVISVSQVINSMNRTFNIGVEIPIELEENVKPNQILNVLLIDYTNNDAISVPSKIIFNDDRGSYVFVVVDFDGEKIARKTPVLVGRSYEYQTEILSGLIGDEIIIDKGALEVMDGTYIKTK